MVCPTSEWSLIVCVDRPPKAPGIGARRSKGCIPRPGPGLAGENRMPKEAGDCGVKVGVLEGVSGPAPPPSTGPRPAAWVALLRTLRARITQKPPCSEDSWDWMKTVPRWMYLTMPTRPLREPSMMVTWSLIATWFELQSLVGRIIRVGIERLMSGSRQTFTSGLSGVPWLVRTRQESFSMWTMTPTVCASSTTRSCSTYSPILSCPVAISADSVRSRAKARNSCCVLSLKTTQIPSSALMTMPVLPVCLPLTHLTWSPGAKYFASCAASNVSASSRSCMSGITMTFPSTAFPETLPVSSFRSPSTTMTLSPFSKVASGRASSLSLMSFMREVSSLSRPCAWSSLAV
mmetsp:Transcript_17152/g.40933  ORF Transcript_17152/g.40933 Transcript_17152/m.40933 type:complete len:347 (-) Transcript_17152:1376-2416(-)